MIKPWRIYYVRSGRLFTSLLVDCHYANCHAKPPFLRLKSMVPQVNTEPNFDWVLYVRWKLDLLVWLLKHIMKYVLGTVRNNWLREIMDHLSCRRTTWTLMSTVPEKAVKLNHSLTRLSYRKCLWRPAILIDMTLCSWLAFISPLLTWYSTIMSWMVLWVLGGIKRFCEIMWLAQHGWERGLVFNLLTVLWLFIFLKLVLTHLSWDKIAASLQTTFSNAFSWMTMHEFRLRFHWNLFLMYELAILQHGFRYWLGADQATGHYLNQWWLV